MPNNPDEIRTRVLTENTAQGVLKTLRDFESNRARMQTRWIWELLQNARDTVAGRDSCLVASITYEQDELVFQHNGCRFTDKEICHLIYHGSTKVEDNDATIGKFGSGFLATHLLSSEIEVTGQLKDGREFKFRLMREQGSIEDLLASMDKSWDEFNDSLSDPPYGKMGDEFTTIFRYPVLPSSADVVERGIETLQQCIPFVAVFNQEFSCIKVKLQEATTRFEVQKRVLLTNEGLQEVTVRKSRNGRREDNKYLLARNLQTSVAFPLQPAGDSFECLPIKGIPRLFLGFPLLGTENFSFPAVINCFNFTPTEDRDGIYLWQGSDKANNTNQSAVEEACELLIRLLQYSASSGWSNIYTLANVPSIQEEQKWFNSTKLQECLKQQFIEKIRDTSMVLSQVGTVKSPSQSILPFADPELGVKDLWELLNGYREFHSLLPRQEEAAGWCSALESWARIYEDETSSFDEAVCGLKLASEIDKTTHQDEQYGTIDDLQMLLRDNVCAVKWLNRLHLYLHNHRIDDAIHRFHIVLDQSGELVKISDLYRDNAIPEDLKDIADQLGLAIRMQLRDTRLFALKDEIGMGDKQEGEVVTEILKELRKCADKLEGSEEKPSPVFVQASTRMLAWLVNQQEQEWDRLHGFPVTTREGNGKAYRLKKVEEGDDMLLMAPVAAWSDHLQPYSELFPDSHILADQYFKEMPDRQLWQKISENRFARTNVITTNVEIKDFQKLHLTATLADDIDHNAKDPVSVTQIAFLSGVLKRVRRSKRLALLFWNFLTTLALHNSEDLKLKTTDCECGKKHSFYPAQWLASLTETKWVPVGPSMSDVLTSQTLAKLLLDQPGQTQEWESLVSSPVACLLHAVGISPVDLMKEFIATDDEETGSALETTFENILAATLKDKSILGHFQKLTEELQNDEGLLGHLEKRRKLRQQVSDNQHLGKLVEDLVRECLEGEGFIVSRTGVGSDFEVEYMAEEADDVASLEIAESSQTWLIEVKATRGKRVRMTIAQAKTAVIQGTEFLLCVVPVKLSGSNPEVSEVRSAMRFVENIGSRVSKVCDDLDDLEDYRKDITVPEDSGIQLEVESGSARVRVDDSLWQAGYRLEDLLHHLRSV